MPQGIHKATSEKATRNKGKSFHCTLQKGIPRFLSIITHYFLCFFFAPPRLCANLARVNITDYIILFILALGVTASIWFRKLTVAGALTGGCLGWLVYKGAGITGLLMLAAFFVAGTLATAIGRSEKERMGIAEENKGQRTAEQVLANGGVAALAGLLAWIHPPQQIMWQLAAAASLSSASADTLSSELGSVYGKHFYNILSFKKDKRGLDGVISFEGTLWGIAGSGMIAVIYLTGYGHSVHAIWIVLAGTAGNLADSLLGASWERKGWLTNNWVNGLNTLVAALTGLFCFLFF
jgi:uncharacterized protein (TIGR00297 family)